MDELVPFCIADSGNHTATGCRFPRCTNTEGWNDLICMISSCFPDFSQKIRYGSVLLTDTPYQQFAFVQGTGTGEDKKNHLLLQSANRPSFH